jgi:hypothetical protein
VGRNLAAEPKPYLDRTRWIRASSLNAVGALSVLVFAGGERQRHLLTDSPG